MTNAIIPVPVDEATALAYSQASEEEQQKKQLLKRLRLHEQYTQSDAS